MFTQSVFTALFGKSPVVKNGKAIVRMNAERFADFSAKWSEMREANNAMQGYFYNNNLCILQAWG